MEKTVNNLSSIENEVKLCTACPLSKTRNHTVFGRGSDAPRVLFIGEAPGKNEDLEGVPFVGAAGQLLDAYLDFINLTKEDYYIANILKCRPPQNRDPLPEEIACCMPFLQKQLRALSPQIIVCLGRIAATHIIAPDFRITAQHGQWFQKGAIQVMATYHPAALLRDPQKKMDALCDFKKIKEKLAEQ